MLLNILTNLCMVELKTSGRYTRKCEHLPFVEAAYAREFLTTRSTVMPRSALYAALSAVGVSARIRHPCRSLPVSKKALR